MARFFGSMESGRVSSPKTITGGPGEGIRAHVRGWNIGVRVQGEAMKEDGEDLDTFRIYVTQGSHAPAEDPSLLVTVAERSGDIWRLRGGLLGEARALLARLTHPGADEEDVQDTLDWLEGFPGWPEGER